MKYASALSGCVGRRFELRSSNQAEVKQLQFETTETKLVLDCHEFFIISQDVFVDEGATQSAFDMERLLTDGIALETGEEIPHAHHHPSVGTRVESNIASSERLPYTVLASDEIDDSGTQKIERSYVLVQFFVPRYKQLAHCIFQTASTNRKIRNSRSTSRNEQRILSRHESSRNGSIKKFAVCVKFINYLEQKRAKKEGLK